MPEIEIRPFRRSDREQVTRLVNRHAGAVLPGAAASVNAVLSQFEREPAEFIVDPWVSDRVALVAEQAGAVAAAALVVRYRDQPDVGDAYRNAGEIRWLVYWPLTPVDNVHWEDRGEAAQHLIEECLAHLERWQVARQYACGSLPVFGVYDVPEQWPHIERLFVANGFVHMGHIETLHLARVDSLVEPSMPPVDGLAVQRSVGINGTRFTAHAGTGPLGYIEVDTDLGERGLRRPAFADIGNLTVAASNRRQGIARLLLAEAARWLHLAGIDLVIAYTMPDAHDEIAFYADAGFVPISRTKRGWERPAVS